MIYLLLKIINPDTRICVSNLKYEIDKSNLAKFSNNVKDLLGKMSTNYSITFDKGERLEDYVCHIFRALLSGPKSTLNCLIERNKDYWDKGT